MKVIYIAGYGRSGSTVLDMSLALDRHVVGTGELTHFFSYWERGDRCSCGKPLHECPVWARVIERLTARFPLLAPSKAAIITRKVESRPRCGIPKDGSLSPELRLYGELWKEVFSSVAQATNAAIVVDSSKSARRMIYRAPALRHLSGLDVNVIHLVRDPRAVMWSYLRGNNVLLEQGKRVVEWGGPYRMLVSWLMTNVGVHAMTRCAQLPVVRIRYEDFTSNPSGVLGEIENVFGIRLDDARTKLEQDALLVPDHGIAGNRMRRAGGQKVRADTEWKAKLPTHLRLVTYLLWPLMLAYGYA